MDSNPIHILLIEDDPADAEYLEELVREDNSSALMFDCVPHLPAGDFFDGNTKYDLMMLDLGLADSHGLDTFRKAKAIARDLPIVALTGLDDKEIAKQCVREGAQDYLVKNGLELSYVTRAVQYALERRRYQKELDSVRQNFENILENSPTGVLVLDDLQKALFANQAARTMFDKKREELEGKFFEYVGSGLPVQEVEIVRMDGRRVIAQAQSHETLWYGEKAELVILNDITALKSAQKQRDDLIEELREALAKVKQLSGLIPICSNCHKIRDDTGFWQSLEGYIMENSDALLSHGLCPECFEGLYPGLDDED